MIRNAWNKAKELVGSVVKAVAPVVRVSALALVVGVMTVASTVRAEGGAIYQPDFSSVQTACLAVFASAAAVALVIFGSKAAIKVGKSVWNLLSR